ncbi:MAG: radical SAM protein [Saprospirales bacterium]|nr:radical SAM protein [Saprospirales bacterium]
MKEPFPVFAAVSIQTNSLCNLKCPFCFYGQYPGYNSREKIASRLVFRIIDELAALHFSGRVSMYNLNEPLTDKRIIRFLKYAKKRLPDCFHFFSTNGVLLTPALLDTLLPLVDHLRINDYGNLPPLHTADPKVEISVKRDFFSTAANNRGGSLRGLEAASVKGTGPCANPFGQLVIMPPGVAVLCCSDGFKQLVMGDLRSSDIRGIWWGKNFFTVRQLLADGRRGHIPLCDKCSVAGGGFYDYFNRPAVFQEIIRKVKDQVYI